MNRRKKQTLRGEYLSEILFMYRPFLFFGLARFHLNGDEISEKSKKSIIYTLFVIVFINICLIFVANKLFWEKQILLYTEGMILINFDIFHTFVLINMCFFNKRNVAIFLNGCIKIDELLGAKDTKFMRNSISFTYFTICVFLALLFLVLGFALYLTYIVESEVVFATMFSFAALYFIYFDLSFFLILYIHLILRVRYLNFALIKYVKINPEYVPNQFPLHPLLWNKNYDKLIKFHERANAKMFVKAFVDIFKQLRNLENCYRFTIFMCLAYLTTGTFVTVQTIIICWKSKDTDLVRAASVLGWCVLSWAFQIMLCQQADMFHRQIMQTKLICAYVQLKPTSSDEIVDLTSCILRVFEISHQRFSIYSIIYFDTEVLLKILSSLFVYVIIQLQLAFPKTNTVANVNSFSINVTYESDA